LLGGGARELRQMRTAEPDLVVGLLKGARERQVGFKITPRAQGDDRDLHLACRSRERG
jgi:hypothetical protein